MAPVSHTAGFAPGPESAPSPGAAGHARRRRGAEPRYELRAFGPRLQRVRTRMRRRGREPEVETRRTLHLVGPRRDVALSIREGSLAVGRLVGRSHALECWALETEEPLPLDADWARRHLPGLLGIPGLGPIGEAPLPLGEIALKVIFPAPQLEIAFVQEHRTRLRLGGVCAEFADARVAGVALETAAVEGASAEAVRRAALLVGLDPSLNTSWPEALRALFVEARASAAPLAVPEGATRH